MKFDLWHHLAAETTYGQLLELLVSSLNQVLRATVAPKPQKLGVLSCP
jgi:hypothetical protein